MTLGGGPALTLLEKDKRRVAIKVPLKELNITYKGKKYNKQNFLGIYYKMLTIKSIETVATKIYERMSYTISYESIDFFLNSQNETYVTKTRKFNKYAKAYIKEEMPTTCYFIELADWKYYYRLYSEKLKNYAAGIPNYGRYQWKYDSKIFKVIFKAFAEYSDNLERFDNSSIPLSTSLLIIFAMSCRFCIFIISFPFAYITLIYVSDIDVGNIYQYNYYISNFSTFLLIYFILPLFE